MLNKNLQNYSNKYINDFRKLTLFITQDRKKRGGGLTLIKISHLQGKKLAKKYNMLLRTFSFWFVLKAK